MVGAAGFEPAISRVQTERRRPDSTTPHQENWGASRESNPACADSQSAPCATRVQAPFSYLQDLCQQCDNTHGEAGVGTRFKKQKRTHRRQVPRPSSTAAPSTPSSASPAVRPSLPPVAPESTPALPMLQTTLAPMSAPPPVGRVPLRYCPNTLCMRPNYSSRRKKCSICQTVLPPPPKHPSVAKLGPDSLVRKKALHIIAMRLGGYSHDEIAKSMGLSKQTIYGYIYRASRNGWVAHDNTEDRIEFSLGTKAVDALEELLTDEETSEKTRAKVALGVMEYVAPKKGGEVGAQQQTVVAIKIEQPAGAPVPIREGTISGTPAFIDAEAIGGNGN